MRSRPVLVILILVLAAPVAAGLYPRPVSQTAAGGLYADGILNLYLTPEMPRLAVNEFDAAGVPTTGVAEFDALCAAHNAVQVIPYYDGVVPEGPMRDVTDRWYRIELPLGSDVESIGAEFASVPGVIEAVPDPVRTVDWTPNDSYYGSQWAMPKIDADSAWGWILGGVGSVSGALIGIVDTGVQWDHTDLFGVSGVNVLEDANGSGHFETGAPPGGDENGFDDDGNGYIDDVVGWDFMSSDNNPRELVPEHGTHVAGCATAVTNNGTGIAGTALDARFVATRHGDGTGYVYNGFAGVVYMSGIGAHVVNCSWSGDTYNSSEQDFINASPILLVCSVGNHGTSAIHYPAGYTGTLAVGALNSNDTKAYFSAYGSWLDVMAPGVSIISTWQTNTYMYADGTSMASPIAAGVCALVKGQNMSLTRDEIITAVRSTCDDIYPQNPSYPYPNLGEGRINARAAVEIVTGVEDEETVALPDSPVLTGAFPNPFNPNTTIAFTLPEATSVRLTVVDVLGREVSTLIEGALPAGKHSVIWDADGFASGTYFARLTTGTETATTKITLLK